jgi:hypothetical protein
MRFKLHNTKLVRNCKTPDFNEMLSTGYATRKITLKCAYENQWLSSERKMSLMRGKKYTFEIPQNNRILTLY